MNKFEVEFDIGGTWIRCYLIRGSRLLRVLRMRTPTQSPKKLRAAIINMFDSTTHSIQVNSIKIGVAGKVRGRRVIKSRNIPALTNFGFSGIFPINIAIKVDNDARVFLDNALRHQIKLRRGVVLGITLGTGIGRALAQNGKVRPLTLLEQHELWEKDYQRKRFQPSEKLSLFVAKKIQPLISRYHPRVIVLGGGVVQNKHGLFKTLSKTIHKMNGINVLHFDINV